MNFYSFFHFRFFWGLMMVGTEVVAGVSEVSKAEIDMSSCQDLAKVGADCNGPKLDVVNVNGNGNVRHDPDGSYLFISDTREVTTDDPNSDKNSDAEVKPVVDSEVKSALEVQFGEVGVENGRTIQSLAEGESHCVLSSTNKDVALHGKPNGEVLDPATTGTVEQPNGTAVEEHENAPLGCQVEDQVETGSSPNQNSQIAVEDNTDGELGESLGSVIFSPKASYSSDENVKSVEINNLHSAPELREMQESIIMSEVDQSNVESNAELGESRESVIKSPEAGDLSDGSVKLAEQNNIDSNAELGKIKISQNVVLVAAGCELSEVVVGEGKSLEQSEVESFREVEESLKSQFRITRCVDSVSHQLDKEEDKEEDNVEKTTYLDVNVDVTVKLANDTDPLEEKATVQKGLNEYINVTLENAASLPSPVCVISQNKIGKMPVECSGSLDDGRVVEQELAISINSQTVLVQEDEVANLVKETCMPWDTKTACNSDSDTIKVAQTKHGDESQQAAELTGNPKHAESLHSTTNDDDDENENENVPVKSCGSFLDSPDVPASDQGLVVAENIGSGLVEGHEAEEVVLQTETAAGPVSDQNKISQIDLLTECIRFPELNGSPGNAESVPCVPVEIDGSIDDNKVTKEKTGELPVESDGSIYDTKVVLQTEIASGPVSDQNEISQIDHLSECVRFPELNGSPENAESVLGVPVDSDVIDDTKVTKEKTGELPVESDGSIYDTNVEMEVENSNLRSTAGSIKSDTKVDNGLNGMSGCPANYVSFETKIEFGSFGPAAIVFTSHCDNMLTKSQVSKGESECSHNQNIYNHLNPQIRKCAGMKSDSDAQSSSAISSSDMSAKDATVPTDAVEEYVLGGEAGTKPFKFLIRFPRFDDQELREKLRDAKLLVDDKTRQRDAVGDEIHRKKVSTLK